MVRHSIYCSLNFLRSWENAVKNPDPLDDDSTNHLTDLYNMMQYRSDIILDIKGDEIIKLQDGDPYLKKLFKSETSKLTGDPGIFKEIETKDQFFQDKKNDFFFLNNSPSSCTSKENSYGLLFIGKDEINKKAAWLSQWERQIFKKKGKPDNYNFIRKFKHPCNAMIIADAYLLYRKSDKSIELNLLSILKNLMPEKLEKQNSFDLTIIIKEGTAIHEKYKFINRRLESLFKYPVNLNIVITGFDLRIHDRNILTNYAHISCGCGFNLFYWDKEQSKQVCSRNTELSYYPHSYTKRDFVSYGETPENTGNSSKTVLDCYVALLNDYKNTIEQVKVQKSKEDILIFGNGINRLLNKEQHNHETRN